MNLKQLIYKSVAIDNITYKQIQTINRNSVEHNNRVDITGLLLYTGKIFIQILEGAENEIDHLFYKKIKSDPLHRSVKVISEGAIQQKNFSTWSMNYFILEQAFFEADVCLKRKYLKPFKQGTLYNNEFLVFSLLYDIHAYILEQSGEN